MFANLDIPIVAAVIAFVYVVILMEPDMILAPWYLFLKEQIYKCRCVWPFNWHPGCRHECNAHPFYPLHNKIANVIFKLTADCERCIAGQAALWWYLFRVQARCLQYNFIEHLFLICLAIFATAILQKIYRECRK